MKSENQCEECDDHLKILLMFQRTADSLGQADQDKAWEVLENPIEEIIAGYITDVVKEYFNVFICIIDFFNLLHGVNKNRRKLFEEIIDDEVGRVQITVVKSPLGWNCQYTPIPKISQVKLGNFVNFFLPPPPVGNFSQVLPCSSFEGFP